LVLEEGLEDPLASFGLIVCIGREELGLGDDFAYDCGDAVGPATGAQIDLRFGWTVQVQQGLDEMFCELILGGCGRDWAMPGVPDPWVDLIS